MLPYLAYPAACDLAYPVIHLKRQHEQDRQGRKRQDKQDGTTGGK